MIGLAFNLVEHYLLDQRDEAALAAALATGGFADADPWLDSLSYPDADFRRWVLAAAEQDAVDLDEFLRRLGRWAMPRLIRRYTLLPTTPRSPKDLIGDLSAVVFPQLRRALLGVSTADFVLDCGHTGADFTYRPSGELCQTIQGALLGLGDHFGVPLSVREIRCGRHGDGSCCFHLDFYTPVSP